MNLSDLAYSLLTGEWRHRRELVRTEAAYLKQTAPIREMLVANHQQRMQLYAGAEPGLNRPMPHQISTPDDFRQASQRIVLLRAARQLEEDGGFFDGILDDFETYVVGENAIWLPNTGNPDADNRIREYCEWQFDQADYTNRLCLTKIAQLAIRALKRDGECGFIPVDVGDSIKLRYYSGDCIGNPNVMTGQANDYNGIVTDPDTDTPVLYRLFKRAQKQNSYTPDREVKAEHFWHFYDPYRFQQFHGVTVFKNAIEDGFDIDQILEFTKLNIKWRASQLPTIHTEDGKPKGPQNAAGWFIPGGGGIQTPMPSGGPPTTLYNDVQGVTVPYLNLNEKVMDYPNDFPNAQLGVSLEEFRRQCCKGAKLPYEFVYRADQGGVIQRFWADKAMKTFGKDKYWIKRGVMNPYKNRVIKKGIETRELDLSPFGDLDVSLAVYKGQWRLGTQISVDYGRETDADLKQIEAGVMSPVDFCADNNRNQEEIRMEIAANAKAFIKAGQKLAQETGLTFDQVMPFLVKKWPNPPALPGGAPIEEDPLPEPGKKLPVLVE